uniref:EGF-like domain-containing protein n=1 Tax=Hippocampus comes TaxID=109280 RepID=A0A3Q2YWI0_HIPCM
MGEECHKGPTPPFPLLAPAEVKSQEPSQDFLDQFAQGSLPNNGDLLLSHCFLGAEQSRSCCKNGGTCILGSFCACPPFFTGRSCEYNQRIRRCGPVPHGEWVRKGCSYCRCGYGLLHCFPRVFHKDCGMDATHYYYHYYLVRSVSGGLSLIWHAASSEIYDATEIIDGFIVTL